MSKAEERALEAYPKDIKEYVDVKGVKSVVDNNCWQRTIFLKGYQQAEKDLALTLVDIKKICLIAREVHKYYGFWSDIVYQDVLNRFNEQKEK